jgi:hypothetical protein
VKKLINKNILLATGLITTLVVIFSSYKVSASVVLNHHNASQQTATTAQRVDQLKTTFKAELNLSTTAQKQLESKCKGAQTALTNLNNHDKTLLSSRSQTFNNLITKLSQITAKLSAQGISSPSLTIAQNQLVSSINQYFVDSVNYQTALQDTIGLDCVSDPIGFKASLLETRKLRTQLLSDTSSIKGQVDTIKAALSDTKPKLNKGGQ